jgi:hypothetical protein
LAVTVYQLLAGGAGSWPILPAAFWRFWAAMALATSVAVTPSWAMRSGFSHRRME